ncbi:alpha/beta hydrolase [Granulosicoccus antarcticus]|uniref:alpha/beta hydrolase n=1 Tax=Granulosicoccus antarcticus TaxID=437505 RepID=UPI0012FE6274|nr:alpha/beta hydrolase [Granulosicoccus antarcticus]
MNRIKDYLRRDTPGVAANLRTVPRCKSLAHLAFCVCLLLPLQAMAAGEKSLDPSLGFSDCSIGTGAGKLLAQCTTLMVPLDPEAADSGSLELAIARIPARRQSASTEAFTLLAGGPGQSALESFPAVSFAFRHIMRDYDVILVDQRGTGDSARLSCPDAPDSLGTEFELDTEHLSELAQECLDSLEHDPRLFTTSVAVKDLEQVRLALGISQWNLYGISYGTRVAQHYLRRYPDRVRTMVLDAVVPPEVTLGPDIAPLAQRTLDLIFQRCVDDSGCFEAFGDLKELTRTLLESLEKQPRTLTFEDVATGKLTTLEFTREHLAITLRLMSYSSQTAAILPSMLHEALINDNFAPLARQANLQSQSLGDSLSTGMHHSVICTEDAPFMTAVPVDEDPEFSYMGDAVVDSLLASCKPWPVGRIDEDFKEPLISDKPVLILSGEADPVTPPRYGEQVAKTLVNSRHLINPQQGHMQAPFGCMPVLLAQFVETADALSLDTDCLERMRVLPFFIDANGPLP